MVRSRLNGGLFGKDKMLLDCLALGLTEAEIGVVMNVATGAIHTRATRIREYSGTKSQPAMVYWALDTYQISPLPVLRPIKLTPRLTEVAELASQGLTDQEIGLKLYLTRPTIMTHIKRLMDRTAAVNRNNMVAILLSAELIV